MSDVEKILEMNHERVRWAEEYTAGTGTRIATPSAKARNDRGSTRVPAAGDHIGSPLQGADCHDQSADWSRNDREGRNGQRNDGREQKRRVLRTASLFCAMLCGMSVTYMVRGVMELDMQTLLPGVIGAVVFLISGWMMDEEVEVLSK